MPANLIISYRGSTNHLFWQIRRKVLQKREFVFSLVSFKWRLKENMQMQEISIWAPGSICIFNSSILNHIPARIFWVLALLNSGCRRVQTYPPLPTLYFTEIDAIKKDSQLLDAPPAWIGLKEPPFLASQDALDVSQWVSDSVSQWVSEPLRTELTEKKYKNFFIALVLEYIKFVRMCDENT